jgi:hypothetical protein
MNQPQPRSALPTLLTFVLGAALGALVVALNTPRRGPRLRRDLKNLAHRGMGRARGAVEALRGHGWRSRRTHVWHVPSPSEGIQVSVNDLPG